MSVVTASVTSETLSADTHAPEAEITAYTFHAGDGRRATVLDVGLAVTEVCVPDRHGSLANVVLAHASPTTYLTNPAYLGAIVGRVANRIAGATLPGRAGTVSLTRNEGRNQLHGGPGGLHARRWAYVDHGSVDGTALHGVAGDETLGDGTPGDGSSAWVRFAVTSPDGDQGYPGTLHVEAVVSFGVTAGGASVLSFDLHATTDAPTPVSLAHHGYWNLAGSGMGTVDDHQLVVRADTFVPVDAEMLPTGEIGSVEGTPFDLRDGARLGERLRSDHPQIATGRGFDHGFVVGDPHAVQAEVREVARLVEPTCGRRLVVHTDQPGLQVYAGGWFDGTLRGRGGRTIRQGDGIAFEPQRLANAVHHPGVYGDVWLHPGETYVQRTRFVLDVVGASSSEASTLASVHCQRRPER